MTTPEAPEKLNKKDFYAVYGALTQLAVHGQENKWWMLYIVLMFNSILLLGCVTLIGIAPSTTVNRFLLFVFSAFGILINICWIVMAGDYVRASNLYGDKAVEAEASLPCGLPKPFTERQAQRADKCFLGTTEFIAHAVPTMLILMYHILIAVALFWR